MSKSILEVSTEVYLKYSSISARQNTSRGIYNLWSNDLVVRVQVYQTVGPRFKTMRWLKNCISLSSFKGQSNEYQGFLGTWWLKITRYCDSAAFRQLNSIQEVVHWDKRTLMDHDFFVKYT